MKFNDWVRLHEMPMQTTLPEGVYIFIKSFPGMVMIRLSDDKGNRLYVSDDGSYTTEMTEVCLGEIRITKKKDFYYVSWVVAKKGFGPLMYDLAMEYATEHGAGLTADILGDVSADARKVWEKYVQRPDVERVQLPVQFQRNASFIYKKQPIRMREFQASGRIIQG